MDSRCWKKHVDSSPEKVRFLLHLWVDFCFQSQGLFAYTMMRAAAVTEKASRVAPLAPLAENVL